MYWCWDTLIELVGGKGPVADMRKRHFDRDVARAAIAQERRAARSAATSAAVSIRSWPSSAVLADSWLSPNSSPPEHNNFHYAPRPSLPLRRQPGVVFRHPLHYELSAPPPTGPKAVPLCITEPSSPSPASSPAASPRDICTASFASAKTTASEESTASAGSAAMSISNSEEGSERSSGNPSPAVSWCRQCDALVIPETTTITSRTERTAFVLYEGLTRQERLARREQHLLTQQCSTTIDENGCVIVRGFDLKSRTPTPTPTRTPTPVTGRSPEKPRDKRSLFDQPRAMARRETWQGGPRSHSNSSNRRLKTAVAQAKRTRSEQVGRQSQLAAVLDPRITNWHVKPIEAGEAESAILSDEEDDGVVANPANLAQRQRGAKLYPRHGDVAPVEGWKARGKEPMRRASGRKGGDCSEGVSAGAGVAGQASA